MGTRIHKALGYGTTNFTPPPGWVDLHERAFKTSSQEFMQYCMDHKPEILALSQDPPDLVDFHLRSLNDARGPLGRCVLYDKEMGLPHVLMLIPLGALPQWYRVDDSIDYYQETFMHQTSEPRVNVLKYGIFPYSKGKPPPEIYGLLLWVGMKDLNVQELLYTYWS